MPIEAYAQPAPESPEPVGSVALMGLRLARLDRHALLRHIFSMLRAGRGGWLVTANLDFLRRYVDDPEVQRLYDAADIRVADGMPLVWASRLAGRPLPERIPGSSLIWLLIEHAAKEGRSVYLLGGAPGVHEKASRILAEKYPSLRLCGSSSPRISMPPTDVEVEGVLAELAGAKPDILLVGLGSPKQEQLIQAIRRHFPSTWMVGIGISLSFITGDVRRAPIWMRRLGIEWIHRLAQEPRRLAKRYIVHDIPFALRLFPTALRARLSPGKG